MIYNLINQAFSNDYFITFIKAIITTIGAFIPIFIIMYVHYRIRKSFYNKIKYSSANMLKSAKDNKLNIETFLNNLYEKFNAKNLLDLIDQLKTLPDEVKREIFSVASDWENQKLKADFEVMKMENEFNHFDKFSFKEYLSSILNQKFPDIYFRNK